MYCNREVAGLGGRCIAIHLVRLEIVLQGEAGLYCSLRGKLYCNRLVYIAIEGGWKQGVVYCNTLHCITT